MSHLQEQIGNCDGTVGGKCYFHCKDNFGIFLPANHIISKSDGTSQVAAEVAKREHQTVESVLKESEDASNKIEEDVQKQELLDAGVPPEELKEQKKKLQQFQQEKEHTF